MMAAEIVLESYKCLIKPFFYFILQSLDRIILVRNKNDCVSIIRSDE